jgi:predicted AAA+ superfamily ATPase
MYRFIEQKIQNWIDHSKKALLIDGARQVGKTYIIREMLSRNHIPYFEINFIERPDILEKLQAIHDNQELVPLLRLLSPLSLKDKKSVIFFDEIQKYPEIVTKIKFLTDEGTYRYALSGSLLGVELKGITSIPVGYVDSMRLFPMSLFEFALALGVKKETLDYIRQCYEKEQEVDSIIHEKMVGVFYYYLITGGMPSAVEAFIAKQDLYEVDKEQKAIVSQYKADFIQYETDDKKLKIISVYDAIPSQLNKTNPKFIFTYLNKELKFDRYENSFLWLKDAGVAIPVYIASDCKAPLANSKEKNSFKLFLSDVGLLTSCYPFAVRKEVLEKNESQLVNLGSLFENFIAEELIANGLPPYYYRSKTVGEVDFLIEKDGEVLPLEIKSGTDYKKHKALNNLMAQAKLKEGVIISPFNLERDGKNLYLPIYMTELLKDKEASKSPITIDITGI